MTAPILVTGATGTVGTQVVRQLVAAGERVRALVRDPAKAAKLGSPVEIAVADLSMPQTLGPAFAGARKAFVVSNGLDIAALEANAFDAAKRAGVEHIVKLSGRHVDADFMQGTPLARNQAESERRLRELGIPWTIVRPGMFASNFLLWIGRGAEAVALPVGDGADTPTDPSDIAAVVVHVLTQAGHEGKVYEITGPEYLSYREMVRRISAALGAPLALVDAPKETVRDGMVAAGIPRTQADGVLRYFVDGVKAGKIYPPTTTIFELLKRPPRSFDDWLADNVARLRA